MHRVNLVIHVPQNMDTGRGIPKFVINLLDTIDKNAFSITLIQSNWTIYKRIDYMSYTKNLEKLDDIITYEDRTTKVNFLMKNKFTSFFVYLIFKPLLMRFDRYLLPLECKQKLKTADLVYLTSNYYSSYAKYNSSTIGSCHTLFVKYGIIGLLMSSLLKSGLIYRFPYVHSFPGYEHYFKRPKTMVFTVPLGINTSIYKPNSRLPQTKIKLLYVATLEKGKGFDIVLQISEIMDSTKYELHVAGAGPMENEISRNIVFHGPLSEQELAALYRNSDIFVYPTRSDTYGTVILEALSSGLVVITSVVVKGIFDVYEKAGYLEYCPLKPSMMYNAIEELSAELPSYDEKLKIHKLVEEKNDSRKVSCELESKLLSIAKGRILSEKS